MPSGTAHPITTNPTDTAPQPPPGSPRADVISGYALALARVAAWAGVSAFVVRHDGLEAFAVLALLRGTITLLGYTSLGLGPALVRQLAEAGARTPPELAAALAKAVRPGPAEPSTADAAATGDARPPMLNYAGQLPPPPVEPVYRRRVPGPGAPAFTTGSYLAATLAVLALVVTIAYSYSAAWLLGIGDGYVAESSVAVGYLGAGVAWRILGEPSSAALQVRGRLAVDNLILAAGEIGWLLLTLYLTTRKPGYVVPDTACCWMVAAAGVFVARTVARNWAVEDLFVVARTRSWPAAKRLLALGSLIVVAQLADFLYAPTDYIIINRLIGPDALAAYAPAVQVDAALLLAVAGIASAVYPWTAVAHAAGDLARVRRYYVRGTLASLALLAAAAAATVAAAGPMLKLWLGVDQPATRAILPLVLVHTVAGGAGAVGRSVLLGMNRAKAFTASVLVAGAAHVLVSVLAAALGFGLRGVVVGTIVVVVARSLVWTPWYVMRALREEEQRASA